MWGGLKVYPVHIPQPDEYPNLSMSKGYEEAAIGLGEDIEKKFSFILEVQEINKTTYMIAIYR
jgi:hypothetical protein